MKNVTYYTFKYCIHLLLATFFKYSVQGFIFDCDPFTFQTIAQVTMETLTLKPSQPSYSTILSGVEDAIGKISSILDLSSNARTKFHEHFTMVIEDFDKDIAVFEEELEKLPTSLSLRVEMKEKTRQELRKKKQKESSMVPTSDSNHALHFHLKRQTQSDTNSNIDDIFLLPADTDKDLRDDDITLKSVIGSRYDMKMAAKRLSKKQKKELEQKSKFDVREKIICKMDELRHSELKTTQRISDMPKISENESIQRLQQQKL